MPPPTAPPERASPSGTPGRWPWSVRGAHLHHPRKITFRRAFPREGRPEWTPTTRSASCSRPPRSGSSGATGRMPRIPATAGPAADPSRVATWSSWPASSPPSCGPSPRMRRTSPVGRRQRPRGRKEPAARNHRSAPRAVLDASWRLPGRSPDPPRSDSAVGEMGSWIGAHRHPSSRLPDVQRWRRRCGMGTLKSRSLPLSQGVDP